MNLTPEDRAACLIEALPYIQKFRGRTFVIKYGGAAMEEEAHVERLLRDIVFLEAVGINPVLVHGGGKSISAKMRAAGLSPRFVQGLRVTCAKTIEIVAETLDLEINPRIVESIITFGGKAVGVSGADVFVAERLGFVEEEGGTKVDVGYVGEVRSVRSARVLEAVGEETVPVISPLGSTESGDLLNINADLAAAALAIALRSEKLIFISDVPGVMRNPEDATTLIPTIASHQIQSLIARKVLTGGMIPKIQAALEALRQGVGKVHFLGGTIHHSLILEIFSNAGVGTEITL